MKKKIFLISVMSIFLLIGGCTNTGDVNNNQKEKVEKKENIYTKFTALGKEYNIGKDINALEVGVEIYNSKEDNPYVQGEYKEVDFANDLISMYLLGDKSVYDSLINLNNRIRLEESLSFLKEQMFVAEEEPIYFQIDSVIYEGKILNEKNTAILNIKGKISKDNNYFVSLAKYSVKVKVHKGVIIGDIE